MERHPVPQHIAGYEFRLIGDMTLKQFVELALGVVLAVICWFLPLPFFLKYPLIGFFILLGVSLAFVPANEQPLDRWIINFIKSIYSPTQYLYQKSDELLELFSRPIYSQPADLAKQVPATDRKKLDEYLQTLPESQILPFDQQLEDNLQRITDLLEDKTTTPVTPLSEPLEIPEIPAMPLAKPVTRTTTAPQFEPQLPMPAKPTAPNLLVGMVLDNQGKILPDVIIEINDQQNFPVRALKTNKLGQFQIATPLKNDIYEIEMEKEGYQFDIIKFEANGSIIEPLAIKAKKGPAHPVNPPQANTG